MPNTYSVTRSVILENTAFEKTQTDANEEAYVKIDSESDLPP